MLVYFHKGITLEGETTETVRKSWWRSEELRHKIYCHTAVTGICDSQDLERAIEQAIKEKMLNTSGWGKDFSGWQRSVPSEDMIPVALEQGWDLNDDQTRSNLRTNRLTVEHINDWTMDRILKTLTGKQFAQFCKECDITLKDIKEVHHYV